MAKNLSLKAHLPKSMQHINVDFVAVAIALTLAGLIRWNVLPQIRF